MAQQNLFAQRLIEEKTQKEQKEIEKNNSGIDKDTKIL